MIWMRFGGFFCFSVKHTYTIICYGNGDSVIYDHFFFFYLKLRVLLKNEELWRVRVI